MNGYIVCSFSLKGLVDDALNGSAVLDCQEFSTRWVEKRKKKSNQQSTRSCNTLGDCQLGVIQLVISWGDCMIGYLQKSSFVDDLGHYC